MDNVESQPATEIEPSLDDVRSFIEDVKNGEQELLRELAKKEEKTKTGRWVWDREGQLQEIARDKEEATSKVSMAQTALEAWNSDPQIRADEGKRLIDQELGVWNQRLEEEHVNIRYRRASRRMRQSFAPVEDNTAEIEGTMVRLMQYKDVLDTRRTDTIRLDK